MHWTKVSAHLPFIARGVRVHTCVLYSKTAQRTAPRAMTVQIATAAANQIQESTHFQYKIRAEPLVPRCSHNRSTESKHQTMLVSSSRVMCTYVSFPARLFLSVGMLVNDHQPLMNGPSQLRGMRLCRAFSCWVLQGLRAPWTQSPRVSGAGTLQVHVTHDSKVDRAQQTQCAATIDMGSMTEVAGQSKAAGNHPFSFESGCVEQKLQGCCPQCANLLLQSIALHSTAGLPCFVLFV